MRELADDSVDAVVTDPPYGLEFMGREWDGADGFRRSLNAADAGRENVFGRTSQKAPEYRTTSKARAGMGATGYTDGSERLERPSFLGGLNPKCLNCGKWQRGGNPCSCDAPEFPNERAGRMHTFQEWCEQWAAECLRVLKPGGHMLAFGGSRTWHRLASAVEDAGFEIRDSIAWLYGSGFPKSMDVAKAITGMESGHGSNASAIRKATMGDDYKPSGVRGNRDGVTRRSDTDMADRVLELTENGQKWQGWGTALKPAFEPIVVGRKPLAGTVATNVLTHGAGALNIDAARVPGGERPVMVRTATVVSATSMSGASTGATQSGEMTDRGRWPTNVILDQSQAAELDTQTGTLTSGKMHAGQPRKGKPADILGAFAPDQVRNDTYGDSGGASRFFPTFRYEAKAPSDERPSVDGMQHPTVKPLDLMRWLVRLVTPPGGTVLEPFAGSGTTIEAALLEGFSCIGIEREESYLPLIMQRIKKPLQQGLFDGWDGAA
ncbi:site-specific DNA-methyltransferase [Herbiconiux sp. SALV-R1]|nr:site-specific DNA-methyltransferase [Herbiconiux sp. SALV-R1]